MTVKAHIFDKMLF